MSTQIIVDDEDHSGVYVCQYYGGEDRGFCYQITQANGKLITLTEYQMTLLIERVRPFLPEKVRP